MFSTAAANSIFGRWDDSKAEENIDFMPTILSRFDTIFIVKDEHNEERDITLARHVMNVHVNAGATTDDNAADGELSLAFLKKYINYARARCGPRLSREAAEKLKNKYVMMEVELKRSKKKLIRELLSPLLSGNLKLLLGFQNH